MDSNGTVIKVGANVVYHGSLTEAHGAWLFAGQCGYCCQDFSSSDYLPECRFELVSPVTGQLMKHVHADSFTLEADFLMRVGTAEVQA